MRTIPQSSLNKILEKEGTDPITLVQIFWDVDQSIIYGDRAFLPEIRGQLLDVSEIENVINSSEGSNTGSVNLRLNDTDGALKTIFDSMDIHKRPVYILQWFPELALSDAFIVFDGVISSPIEWKEGERTLSFEVISKIEDLEVGYSAEEGNFEYIPPNVIGKAWPLVFGTALRVPALRINDVPSSYTTEDTGIDALGEAQGTLSDVSDNELRNISVLMELERQCFTMAAILLGNADSLNRETGGDLFNRQSSNPLAQQLYDLGTQYEAMGNEYLKERMLPINNNQLTPEEQAAQDNLEKNQVAIANGNQFPQGQNMIITINGAKHEGYFQGDIFTIVSRTHPFADQSAVVGPTEVIDRAVATEYKTDLGVETFFYAVAGSNVGIASGNYPVFYIVGIPWLSNIVVLAKKSNNVNKFVVPSSYYAITYAQFGTLKATILTMYQPLTSRGEGWADDEIWCNCTSPVGPNAVDIMEYLVENYTNQSIDATTFAAVRTDVNPYKCGFALLERKNCLEVLQEIAYQSRCSIWFKGGRFFLKYLPKKAAYVETFTEDDVESGTLEVFGTDTEDVVTKWEINWRPRLDLEPQNKIVYRYHIAKYGMIQENYDCYIYNNKKSVEKFAIFWLIRKANTWKKIRFSTFMTKLRVEPFDSVLINFTYPWVNSPSCTEPTVGIVEQASYDSATQRIQMVIWLPIRFGEMCPHDFAYPSDVDITMIFPQETDTDGIDTDIPGAGATEQLYDQTSHTGPSGTPYVTPPNSGSGGGVSPSDDGDDAVNPDGSTDFDPPVELSPNSLTNGTAPSGVKTYSQRTIKPLDNVALDIPDAVYPGFVVSAEEGSNNTYKVNIYQNGLVNETVEVMVKQLMIDTDDIIPGGTPCLVSRNASRNEEGLVENLEYTMQVPIWLKPKESTEADDDQPEPVPPGDEGSEPPVEEEPPPETDEGDQ